MCGYTCVSVFVRACVRACVRVCGSPSLVFPDGADYRSLFIYLESVDRRFFFIHTHAWSVTPVARLFLTRLGFEKIFKTQGIMKTQMSALLVL